MGYVMAKIEGDKRILQKSTYVFNPFKVEIMKDVHKYIIIQEFNKNFLIYLKENIDFVDKKDVLEKIDNRDINQALLILLLVEVSYGIDIPGDTVYERVKEITDKFGIIKDEWIDRFKKDPSLMSASNNVRNLAIQ